MFFQPGYDREKESGFLKKIACPIYPPTAKDARIYIQNDLIKILSESWIYKKHQVAGLVYHNSCCKKTVR
jgi:hypothetical protein